MQRKLVIECERAWDMGIRGRNLSGRTCEILLRDFLRKEIPEVNANEGAVVLSRKKGFALSGKEISPQVDIILYKKEPVYRYKDVVAVHKDRVILVVEVKKWTSPTDLLDQNKFNKAIGKLKNAISKPVFFVTFRHFGTSKHYGWTTANHVKRHCKADKSYVFSRPTGSKLPWQVSTNIWLYPGELQNLIDDIRNEINGRNPKPTNTNLTVV